MSQKAMNLSPGHSPFGALAMQNGLQAMSGQPGMLTAPSASPTQNLSPVAQNFLSGRARFLGLGSPNQPRGGESNPFLRSFY